MEIHATSPGGLDKFLFSIISHRNHEKNQTFQPKIDFIGPEGSQKRFFQAFWAILRSFWVSWISLYQMAHRLAIRAIVNTSNGWPSTPCWDSIDWYYSHLIVSVLSNPSSLWSVLWIFVQKLNETIGKTGDWILTKISVLLENSNLQFYLISTFCSKLLNWFWRYLAMLFMVFWNWIVLGQ